jgi:uncharacterized membrane protein
VALGSIALAFSPWGLTRTSVVAAAAAFTVAAAAVAVSRRAAVPFDDRPAPASLASLLPVRRGGRGATVANAAVVLALVVFVASVGFAASVPGGTDPYTGFSVSAVDAGGAPVTPGLLAPGSESTLTVTVGNEEAATVAYAVVVTRERVVADADGGLTVVGSEAVGRYEFTLADGGTWSGDHLAVVPEEGRYRFTFALYRDGAAGEPYRQLVVHSRG